MNGVERLGRYVLGDLLGEGATGRVYRATLLGPAGFRKPVAIKVLAPEVAHRDGLTREACLGGLIKHPHVVETWELGEWEGRPYVVMELVDGPSLAEVIGRGPLPPRAVVELGEHAAAGLAHIHRPASEGGPGLVHRDIKPANLLFDPVGLVKIADLGIALVLGDAARSLAGTPQWMAPEQARRQLEVTPAADVWALGMILVYAATGRRLPGSGALDVLRGAPVAWLEQQGTFDAVAAAVPGLAPVLRRVLVEAPAARPTAAEVLEQLRALHPTGPGLRAAIDLRPAASPHPTPERSPVASAAPTWDLVEGRTNVTPPADPFFGRDALLAQLLSGSDRIVTLTGPGGAGKTRLAREWALSALRTDPTWTGAWLVELEQAADAVGLARGVAAALGVPLIDARDPVSHVADAAAARGRTLVVLDNLEQVADAAGAVVARWAAAAPEVTWVITSRVPLRIAGERVVPVEALDPEAACALVRDRLVRAGVSPWPAPSVRALVDALDGLPLALELAAARARVLGPDELLRRLAAAGIGKVLHDRARVERHATLMATVTWSWNLLPPEVRRALSRLTVLAGDFDPATAEAVIDDGGTDPLDLLELLVDHSLIRPTSIDGPLRLAPWVAVREVAAAALGPDDTEAAERAHVAWFAGRAARWAAEIDGPTDERARHQVLRDRVELSTAADRAWNRGDLRALRPLLEGVAIAAEMVGPLGPALVQLERAEGAPSSDPEGLLAWRGRLTELAGDGDRAIALLRRAVSGAPPGSPTRARAAAWLGGVLADQGQAGLDEARAVLDAAIGDARACGNRAIEAYACAWLGSVHRDQGRPELAREIQEGALAATGEAGPLRLRAWLESELGVLDTWQKRPGVDARMARALELLRAAGDRVMQGRVHGKLASSLNMRGDTEQARQHAELAVQIGAAFGDRVGEGIGHEVLGLVASRLDDPITFEACARRALTLRVASGDQLGEAVMRLHIGLALRRQGRAEPAKAEFERGLVVAQRVGLTRIATVLQDELARVGAP